MWSFLGDIFILGDIWDFLKRNSPKSQYNGESKYWRFSGIITLVVLCGIWLAIEYVGVYTCSIATILLLSYLLVNVSLREKAIQKKESSQVDDN